MAEYKRILQSRGWGRRDCLRKAFIGAWILGGFAAVLVCLAGGCDSYDSKKAALTEQEIRDLTYGFEPSRPGELMVSGEKVTCEDVLASVPEEASMPASFKERLEQLAVAMPLDAFLESARPVLQRRLYTNVTNIVLYKRASRQIGDKVEDTLEKLAESQLRQFVMEHGGNNAQADEALKAMGLNRMTFKERKKREALAEYAVSTRIARNRPITYSETAAKYDEMKDPLFVRPGVLQFRLIDIEVAKMELSDPNDNALQKAQSLAESLVTRICAEEDFGALAEQYSHGFRAAMGGLWEPRDPESLADPYDVLAKIAEKIEVGEIAGPIAVPGRFFIMKLVRKEEKGYLSLPEVQDQVERQIRIDRRLEGLKELDTEIASQIQLVDTGEFVDHCLKQLHAAANSDTPAQPVP